MMKDSFTYGCELEWSDIDRSIDIPKEIGSWEGPKINGFYMGSEIDIVNTQGRWKGHGTDPLCMTCPVGGEIHTVPSPDIDSQLIRIMRIMNLFPKLSVACPNHGHIHVKVPGLKTDLQTLKNFFEYLENNEEDIIRACCGYGREEHDKIVNSDLEQWVKSYLIIGDGKHISPELYKAISEVDTIDQALKVISDIPCVDWDCITNEFTKTTSSHRTAVNMYNLLKGDTIEFRIFRASLNPVEIYSCLDFVRQVVTEAVKGKDGVSVLTILQRYKYEFPKLNFDYDLALGWQNTRQTKGRCGPFKKSFSSATVITTDPITDSIANSHIKYKELSDQDQGLASILTLCRSSIDGISQSYFWNNPII